MIAIDESFVIPIERTWLRWSKSNHKAGERASSHLSMKYELMSNTMYCGYFLFQILDSFIFYVQTKSPRILTLLKYPIVWHPSESADVIT